MKNIRTVCLLSATCLTLMGADGSFASLYQSFYPGGYTTGREAESTSICRGAASSHIGRSSHHHTHLAAALPAPHISTGVQSEQRDLFVPISQQQSTGSNGARLASVCFISDTGECSGNIYGGAGTESSGGTPPGGGDDWIVDNGEKCWQEGYTDEDCDESGTPGLACPYDSGWHTGCVCKPEYNKTCTGSDEQGKGASCNGKYKECCKLCSGYDYTTSNIPSGYVKGASCTGCDGVKYKIKCDTNSSNTGTYISCGSATGGGKSCTDDMGTYYERCTCPTNYEFNAQTQTCVCKTNFKYACTGTGYAGGQGESCDNKYQTCECATGYNWSATSGCVKCGSSFKYACTGANEVKPSGSNCGGLYDKCSCKSGYKWSGGKCVAECDSSYKYTCTGTGYAGGVGSACGGKYIQCTCASGYEWKNGSCQKETLNGAVGNLCYCNDEVIGVKTDGMNFFVGLKDIGYLDLVDAEKQSKNYFCTKFSGQLPSKDQLFTIYNQKSQLNNLFLSNKGTRLTEAYYWSSTPTSNPYTNYLVDISSGRVSTMDDIYSSYLNGANVRAMTTCGLVSTEPAQPAGPDYSACEIGTLFYSDNTCSYNMERGKELLGVVIYEKTATESGWVMAIEPIATDISWGIEGISAGTTDTASSASCTNTAKLVALGSNYPAAAAVNKYNVGGRKWCLPSVGVFDNFVNQEWSIDYQTNIGKVNVSIAMAGGTLLGRVSLGYECIWTSSEYNNEGAWNFGNCADGRFRADAFNKSVVRDSQSVRPVFAF